MAIDTGAIGHEDRLANRENVPFLTTGRVELRGFEPLTPWLQTTLRRISANYSDVLQQLRTLSTPWRITRNVSVRAINA